jgi:3-oxoacyl-[acyl-carrier-protein] synthase II
MGVVSPLGHDIETFWNNIQNGVCGIEPISAFDTTHSPVKLAAEVKRFDPEPFIGKLDTKHNARFMQFARVAAQKAYEMSRMSDAIINSNRLGVYVSSSIGGIETLEKAYENFDPSTSSRVSPYLIPNTLVNLASGAIAIDLGAKGRNLAIVTACASGANAIGEAYKSIQRGEQDVIVAGAADAAITPLALAGFAAMRAMYTGDNPTRACIPFDNERSGTVMGEGAGIIILEELEHARARKAPIFAEIIGYGTTCDAYSITTPEQEGTSISQAMQQALDDASISPDAVDYINAHGTSTILNDQTETRAIKKVFGEDTKIPVSSTKSMTGHLLGAGGAVEAIISIQALINDFLPATVNFKVRDPECDINLITGDGEHTNIDTVLSNSFGFGGHNASLIVKKWQN